MTKIPIKPGVPKHMKSDDTRTFDEWMTGVDYFLVRYIGLNVDDLPDCPYRQWYDERIRPIYAANKAIRLADK